jgi:hypothetical protein
MSERTLVRRHLLDDLRSYLPRFDYSDDLRRGYLHHSRVYPGDVNRNRYQDLQHSFPAVSR